MGEKLELPVSHPLPDAPISWMGKVGSFMCPLLSTSSMEGTIENIYHPNLEGGHQSEIPLRDS